MPKEFFLPVPLYLQVDCYNDTNVKCGAACTQMVLHDIDPQRLFKKGEQDELFDQIRKAASRRERLAQPASRHKKGIERAEAGGATAAARFT